MVYPSCVLPGAVKPGLTVPSTCERCGIPMNVGDMAVFAFHAGPDLCWHVECFVCSNDGGLLVDHVYCWDSDERKLFCPRHWNECLKPRCAGCEEVCFLILLFKGLIIVVMATTAMIMVLPWCCVLCSDMQRN